MSFSAGTKECYTSFTKTYSLEVGSWPKDHSPASLTGSPNTADGEHRLWNNNTTHLTSNAHLTIKGLLLAPLKG